MNTDEIIRMAQECQLIGMRPHLDGIYQQSLVRFAALVAAAEREACLEICVLTKKTCKTVGLPTTAAEACVNAIRARGNE
jgi:hypothetical protein